MPNRSAVSVCRWQELIDVISGRCPVIRATGRDVVYELRVHDRPEVRLVLRCDDAGDIYANIHAYRKTA